MKLVFAFYKFASCLFLHLDTGQSCVVIIVGIYIGLGIKVSHERTKFLDAIAIASLEFGYESK